MSWKYKTKEIIKLLVAFRKDPFLLFSGLLVSSGCLLLTTSILEIIINFAAQLIFQDHGDFKIDSNFSTIIGLFLIISGITLFYNKFIKKSALSKEYKRDSELIKKLFFEITSLDKLDFFIDKALYPYLVDSVIDDFESFQFYKTSSHYHVYDNILSELIDKFYDSWGTIFSHYQAFTPTRNDNILRPDTIMDMAMTEHVQTAIDEVPKAAKLMHKNQMELLKYIRNTYKDIEI